MSFEGVVLSALHNTSNHWLVGNGGPPHHESGDQGLGGVGRQVQLHVGPALPLGAHHNAVPGQARTPRQLVGLGRRRPAHPEGRGRDLGERDVTGGWDGCRGGGRERVIMMRLVTKNHIDYYYSYFDRYCDCDLKSHFYRLAFTT